jgi:hypothetical protein
MKYKCVNYETEEFMVPAAPQNVEKVKWFAKPACKICPHRGRRASLPAESGPAPGPEVDTKPSKITVNGVINYRLLYTMYIAGSRMYLEPGSVEDWGEVTPGLVPHEVADRQSDVVGLDSPLMLGSMVWLALVLLHQLLPPPRPPVSSSEPSRLQSDDMCGITTEGQVGRG